jgi:hypothetical protein
MERALTVRSNRKVPYRVQRIEKPINRCDAGAGPGREEFDREWVRWACRPFGIVDSLDADYALPDGRGGDRLGGAA